MIFLGQASNYSVGRTFAHLFAVGTKQDSKQLRRTLADRYNAPIDHTALYHSGRSALAVGIHYLVRPNSPVIVPGLTCIAVVRAVRAAHCQPVYCDITPENLEYDYDQLADLLEQLSPIDRKQKVCYNGIIIVQNTLGRSWDVRKIQELADRHHFAIVEDLAHSAGRFYTDGREVGTVGAATALSFGKGKAIDTICGGALILRNGMRAKIPQPIHRPRWAERWRDRWYPFLGSLSRWLWPIGLGKPLLGLFVRFHWIEKSADTKLDTGVRLTHWQAKLALKQLNKLSATDDASSLLWDSDKSDGPGPLREYTLVHDRDRALAKLNENGYRLDELWYDTPVSPARYAAEADFPYNDCPQTMEISEQIVNLPTWYSPEKLARAREIIAKYEIRKPEGVKDE